MNLYEKLHDIAERHPEDREDLLKAAKHLERWAGVIRHLSPEKYPYTAFIIRQSKERNEGNLPLTLDVVPAFGVDFSVTYELKV